MYQKKIRAGHRACLRLSALAVCLGTASVAFAHPGDFNKSFGTDGAAAVPAAIASGANTRIAVDSMDRVVFGYNTTLGHAEIAALTEGGMTDTAFGISGFVELGNFADIKVDSKDRYIVLGHVASSASGVEVMRYMNNGSLDPTFGVGGVAVVTTDSAFNGQSIAVDGDDNVVIVGGEITRYSPQVLFAARVTNAGDIDESFGKHGIRSLPLSVSGSEDTVAQAVAIDHAGNIYLSAYSGDLSPMVNRLVKLKPNGSLDKHFGPGSGVVTSDASATMIADFTFAGSMAIDEKDNIVIAGGAGRWSASQMFVARFRPDGTADRNFGGGTFETFNVGTSDIAQAYGTLIDQRGRIVLTGIGQDSLTGEPRLLVTRLKKDGSPDSSFDANLLPTSAWNGVGVLTTTGNILVAGEAAVIVDDSILVDELTGG